MKSNNNISKKQTKSLHYVYIIHCLLTGEYYFGKHSTNKKNDSYLGSGSELNKRKKELGRQYFKRELVARFNSEEEAKKHEEDLIEHFISDIKCLNKTKASVGNKCGYAVYKYPSGKIAILHINDPDVLSGLVVGKQKGLGTYITKEGKKIRLKTDDLRVLSGEVISINKGRPSGMKNKKHTDETKNIMKEKATNRKHTDKTKKHLQKIGIGIGSYRYPNGNVVRLAVNHPDVISGLVVGSTKGRVPCVLPDGTKKSLHKTDPLYIKGIAVHVTTGKPSWNKGKKNHFTNPHHSS